MSRPDDNGGADPQTDDAVESDDELGPEGEGEAETSDGLGELEVTESGEGGASSEEPSAIEAADVEDGQPSLALVRRRAERPASAERLYIVTYDIKSPRRWRRVFRTMKGYGRWLQLSVFQCRLTGRRRADLGAALEELIHHHEDHVIILDLGPADQIDPRVESMGKSFTPIARQAIVV